jgi:hypothetical protein
VRAADEPDRRRGRERALELRRDRMLALHAELRGAATLARRGAAAPSGGVGS